MSDPDKIRDFIAPSVDKRVKIRTTVNDYAYYAIIVIVSMMVAFVPPLVIGSLYGDVGLFFPTTVSGWVLWALVNGSTSIGNVSILVMFKLQARKNCKNNDNYIKANEILARIARERDIFVPRSPRAMDAKEYITKGIFIVLGSVCSFIVISSIVIAFDMVTLISTGLSVLMSLCMSWCAMIKNEEYWCNEYLLYAEMIENKINKGKESEHGTERQDLLAEHPATGPEESAGD